MTADQFWSGWWWPALTAALGFVYTWLLLRQWLKRRKMHQLMWTIGFLFYAVAALMEAWSEYVGHWDPTVYRIYIVLAATLVGFLANWTVFLIFTKPVCCDIYLVLNIVGMAIFLWSSFNSELLINQLI